METEEKLFFRPGDLVTLR
jgi:uncharacterized protein YodC (DUF2158 family)